MRTAVLEASWKVRRRLVRDVGGLMRSVTLWVLAPFLCGTLLTSTQSRPSPATALTGLVSSADEGPMEGVLVSAKKTASTITASPSSPIATAAIAFRHRDWRLVSTRCEFARLATISSRAAGRDRRAHGRPRTLDLKLQKTRDLASQLTNADWFASFPGTDAAEDIRSAAARTVTRSSGSCGRTTTRTGWWPSSSGCPRIRSCPSRSRSRSCRRRGSAAASSRPSSVASAWRRQAEYLTTTQPERGIRVDAIRSRHSRGRRDERRR